jgi:hypothetical protein
MGLMFRIMLSSGTSGWKRRCLCLFSSLRTFHNHKAVRNARSSSAGLKRPGLAPAGLDAQCESLPQEWLQPEEREEIGRYDFTLDAFRAAVAGKAEAVPREGHGIGENPRPREIPCEVAGKRIPVAQPVREMANRTRLSGLATGNGFQRTASSAVKMEALAPMPSASETARNCGSDLGWR